VEFRIGNVYHPDSATIHEMWCRNFTLQGVCEEIVSGDAENGPYAVVRIEAGEDPVIISLKHVDNVIWESEK